MTNIFQLFDLLFLPVWNKASPLRHEDPAFHQMLQNTTKIENFLKLFYLDFCLFSRFLILLLQCLWVLLVPKIDTADATFSHASFLVVDWYSLKFSFNFWCSVRKSMLDFCDQAFQINMLSSEILTKYSFHTTNHIVYLTNGL